MFKEINRDNPVVAWWSGGAASAITCKLCIDWFGVENVAVIFIGTRNEDDDTERFRLDCERWYGTQILEIRNKNYESIQEVWYRFLSLNSATGAICSSELKREVRKDYQNKNPFSYQAFGFDISEINRAKNMRQNYPDSKPIFPLIYELLDKKDVLKLLKKAGIEPPNSYKMGYSNNNCLKTGCVQGGIGYWQKFQKDFPDRFEAMAKLEHELTNEKGKPVTICKDQSKGGGLVFLKPHLNYPNMKDISMMKGRTPEPLMECNGFCGVKSPIELQQSKRSVATDDAILTNPGNQKSYSELQSQLDKANEEIEKYKVLAELARQVIANEQQGEMNDEVYESWYNLQQTLNQQL